MTNKELLCEKIKETENKAISLMFADILLGFACSDKDLTKKWALKAEKILNDINSKYEEFYRYCKDFYENEKKRKKNERYN